MIEGLTNDIIYQIYLFQKKTKISPVFKKLLGLIFTTLLTGLLEIEKGTLFLVPLKTRIRI